MKKTASLVLLLGISLVGTVADVSAQPQKTQGTAPAAPSRGKQLHRPPHLYPRAPSRYSKLRLIYPGGHYGGYSYGDYSYFTLRYVPRSYYRGEPMWVPGYWKTGPSDSSVRIKGYWYYPGAYATRISELEKRIQYLEGRVEEFDVFTERVTKTLEGINELLKEINQVILKNP